MNTATDFDVGPLTWVKSDIDIALERASQALDLYTASVTEGSGDLTQIKFCRTHLHQVHGALTIVGLDGVTQFTQALESMLAAVEQQTLLAGESTTALAHSVLGASGHILTTLSTANPISFCGCFLFTAKFSKREALSISQPRTFSSLT